MGYNFIPYNQPLISDEEIKEVIDTIKSGWLTMGPKTIEFENLISEYIGVKNAIAVNSCTAALHLSLLAHNIGSGDEVITSPFTFASTGNVIFHVGAKPVFVDIDRDYYNMDETRISEAITKKTKAIIPVHYAGQACNMKPILEIAEDNNLVVIEDAAHAMGTEYQGRKIGSLETTSCFSFYATKNLTTGEGGAITTHDNKLADKLRRLRLHGINKDAWNRYSKHGSWYYEIEDCGWKYNMTDLQASLGLHQIKRIDEFTQTRQKLAMLYHTYLSEYKNIIIPKKSTYSNHVYHLYPILLLDLDRNSFIKKLYELGIGCSVHFIPLHLHPFYRNKFGFGNGDFPNAEWVYQREISLPLYPKMRDDDILTVISRIKEVLT